MENENRNNELKNGNELAIKKVEEYVSFYNNS